MLQVEGLKKGVSLAAIRALAILGKNEEVGRAVGRPGPEGRGVRILSMDGGGMKVRSTPNMILTAIQALEVSVAGEVM